MEAVSYTHLFVAAENKKFKYLGPYGLMTSASPDVIRTARYFFHGFLSMTAPAKYIAINPSPDTTPP